jgi:hypothetical protein
LIHISAIETQPAIIIFPDIGDFEVGSQVNNLRFGGLICRTTVHFPAVQGYPINEASTGFWFLTETAEIWAHNSRLTDEQTSPLLHGHVAV